jgi:glycerophosphoryl diester phosphodiesterase
MMMKKWIAGMLCLIMLMGLTACGEPITPDVTSATVSTTSVTEITSATVEPTEASTTATEVTTEATTAETEAPAEPTLMYQAHRGLSTDFPENTIPAFQGAIDYGFKFIELDPNFTKDNQCVLMHDSTINRTCRLESGASLGDSKIALNSITYEQLSKYDAGLFKGAQFKGTKVPLLSEVAELVKGTGVALKLDNKIWNYTDEQIEIIFKIAETSDADIGFTCKSMYQVERVVARLPEATIHYDGPISKAALDALDMFNEGREMYIWVGIDSATAKICDMVKEVGHLGLWTLSSEAQLEKAISLGAEVIETNGELKP